MIFSARSKPHIFARIASLFGFDAERFGRHVLSQPTPATQIRAVTPLVLALQLEKGRLPSAAYLVERISHGPIFRWIEILHWTRIHGPSVRARTGKVLFRQMWESRALVRSFGIPPRNYYRYELFAPARFARAGEYLQRSDTKGSLYRLLKRENATPLRDKLRFGLALKAVDLGAAPNLVALEEGRIVYPESGTVALPPCDLFVKPRTGKGGRGAARWHFNETTKQWEQAGLKLNAAQLLDHLARLSMGSALLVQTGLRNHSDLRALSGGALCTVRIVSCKDDQGGFHATHAAFRVALTQNSVVDNFHAGGIAAKVDMATGKLGPATDLGLRSDSRWHDIHPYNAQPIAGRILPLWREAVMLVERAHAQFADRLVIGWDVAILEHGPCIIEANAGPDLDIIQRTHGEPLGNSPLGQWLAHHMRQRLYDLLPAIKDGRSMR